MLDLNLKSALMGINCPLIMCKEWNKQMKTAGFKGLHTDIPKSIRYEKTNSINYLKKFFEENELLFSGYYLFIQLNELGLV